MIIRYSWTFVEASKGTLAEPLKYEPIENPSKESV